MNASYLNTGMLTNNTTEVLSDKIFNMTLAEEVFRNALPISSISQITIQAWTAAMVHTTIDVLNHGVPDKLILDIASSAMTSTGTALSVVSLEAFRQLNDYDVCLVDDMSGETLNHALEKAWNLFMKAYLIQNVGLILSSGNSQRIESISIGAFTVLTNMLINNMKVTNHTFTSLGALLLTSTYMSILARRFL